MVSYVIEALRSITTAGGYTIDIGLVELKDRLTRDLNGEDLPAILISLGNDDFDRETFASGDGNTQFRLLDLTLHVRGTDEPDVLVPGSKLKTAIMRCLLRNRCADDGKQPWDITIGGHTYSEFERIENGVAQLAMSIRLKYAFTLEDL